MPAGMPLLCNCSSGKGKPSGISQSSVAFMLVRSFLAEYKYEENICGCSYLCVYTQQEICRKEYMYRIYTCVDICVHAYIHITKFPGKHLNSQYACYILW